MKLCVVFKKQNKQTKTKHQTCMNCRGSNELGQENQRGGRHTEPIY